MLVSESSFYELGRQLFGKEKDDLFIKSFTMSSISRQSRKMLKNNQIKQMPMVNLGSIEMMTIKIYKCCGATIPLSEKQFYNKLMYSYNKDYWMITLWLCMYELAKDNSVAREIVRAFIIRCVHVTSSHLVGSNTSAIIDSQTISKRVLPEKTEFYSQIFNPADIILLMRTQYRLRLRKIMRRKWNKSTRLLNECRVNCPEELEELFIELNMKEIYPLFQMHSNFVIPTPISFLGLLFSRKPKAGDIKRELIRILNSKGE
jgi:hypothetical protein